jgi:hypothetical protein
MLATVWLRFCGLLVKIRNVQTIVVLAALSRPNRRIVGETRMRRFGNTMLRRIFASRDEEVTGS